MKMLVLVDGAPKDASLTANDDSNISGNPKFNRAFEMLIIRFVVCFIGQYY